MVAEEKNMLMKRQTHKNTGRNCFYQGKSFFSGFLMLLLSFSTSVMANKSDMLSSQSLGIMILDHHLNLLPSFVGERVLDQEKPFQYQLAMAGSPESVFHGRIIDQYGKPVSGALIWYGIDRDSWLGSGRQGYAESGDDGYFSITVLARPFELGAVTHDEIDEVSYRTEFNHRDYFNDRQATIRFYPYDSKSELLNLHRYDSRKHAFIVHAWRLQGYEGAKAGRTGNKILPDGREYTINLRSVDRGKKFLEGALPGDLRVTCKRKSVMANIRDFGDWVVTISAINGGIQVSNDLYMNVAPENGYKPELEFGMKTTDPEYEEKLLAQRMYFYSNDGEVYGSLFATLLPFREKETCSLKFQYRYNPTGSRSLELKPVLRWKAPVNRR